MPIRELTYRLVDLDVNETSVDGLLASELLQEAVADQDAELESSAVQLSVRLTKHNSIVQCDGRLSGHLVMPCQRCLGPARVEIDEPIRTVFAPPTTVLDDENSLDAAASDDDDDLDYAHHDGEVVDLWSVVREYIILSVPMLLLCKDECLGLCQACGTDRNTSVCNCRPEPMLSPFAALRDIKP
jgi:uncharacterized protein